MLVLRVGSSCLVSLALNALLLVPCTRVTRGHYGGMRSHLVLNTQQGQIIQQIMAQYYQGEKARNMLMLNILSECAAVLSAPGLDASDTFCSKVLDC